VDSVAFLQVEAGAKCIKIHHIVYKDDHNVGYPSKEPRDTPQLYGGST